ncbi:MAG: PhoD-like phosphatase N-terminal domain-containing protein [Kiloniellales bacterium]|nr:PhoD-like phosphatase N-terminal domain-containing protein [Kiloniellales bacterium]
MLWTRLAPEPLGGPGLPGFPIPVRWEVAADPGMARVLRRGLALAKRRDGYAVHVQVAGLPSDGWFYYRFDALGEHSRIGRVRPRASGRLSSVGEVLLPRDSLKWGAVPALYALAVLALANAAPAPTRRAGPQRHGASVPGTGRGHGADGRGRLPRPECKLQA